jgi:nitroimidazol reductase NimA-like FMN-containing flavoprotein (pyridoxamine 5'-phosphate oxidase superfamily)
MEQDFIESREEMEEILKEEEIGFLGVVYAGRPYVVPLNYAYRDGKIIFHCALEGRKLEAIRQNPVVSFAVARQLGPVRPHGKDPCHLDSDSVICTGVARIVEDVRERMLLLNAFNRRFRPEAEDRPLEQIERCGCVEITLSEMTGRRERERVCTMWRYVFGEIQSR